LQTGEFHPKSYPEELDQLVGPKRVFKIKVVPGGNPASVIQFNDNPQLLANLEKQFGLEEVYK